MDEKRMDKVASEARAKRIKELATFMHDEYEKAAREVGWKTQESCRVEFDNLPEDNKKVMLTVAEKVIDRDDRAYENQMRGYEI